MYGRTLCRRKADVHQHILLRKKNCWYRLDVSFVQWKITFGQNSQETEISLAQKIWKKENLDSTLQNVSSPDNLRKSVGVCKVDSINLIVNICFYKLFSVLQLEKPSKDLIHYGLFVIPFFWFSRLNFWWKVNIEI